MLTIGALHSGAASFQPLLEQELGRELDGFRVISIMDATLIGAVIADGQVTSRTNKRVLHLCEALFAAGADLVVDTCSSIGEAAELANRLLEKPVLRIDAPMAEEAARRYRRIGVVATLPTTLRPTTSCLLRAARRLEREITVRETVAPGAFECFQAGDVQGMEDRVVEAAKEMADVDALILAQVSMTKLQPRIAAETGKPVLASPPWLARHIGEAARRGAYTA